MTCLAPIRDRAGPLAPVRIAQGHTHCVDELTPEQSAMLMLLDRVEALERILASHGAQNSQRKHPREDQSMNSDPALDWPTDQKPPSEPKKALYPFWPEPLSLGQLKDFKSMLGVVIAVRSGRVDCTCDVEIFFDDEATTLVLSAARPVEPERETAE